MKTTPAKLHKVWVNLTAYIADIPKDRLKYFCQDLDTFLDELSSQDAFGTEGQNDPRGDQRNQ